VDADKPIAGGSVDGEAHARAVALVGTTVGSRYRIEELVAQGGIASVFRATRLADGHEVAIKVLHRDAESRPELTAHFEREAIAGRHIFHPNVVTVHESARLEDGSWFLVQDFVRGETLRELIDRGPVPALRVARIARQVASGLNAAHDMGIVHRDIKPRNLMFVGGSEDKVHIVDFGLAQVPVERLAIHVADGRDSLTPNDVVLGTMAYLAPEAAQGMKAIDRRSDLYALGVIMYEMLAGRHPFSATDPVGVFTEQVRTIPPAIRDRSPGVEVPPALERVVQRLLEKDPHARYPHARAVMVALDGAIDVITGDVSEPRRVPRGLLLGIAAAALALVVVLLAWHLAASP
jgi:serine/threonine-protein kinase